MNHVTLSGIIDRDGKTGTTQSGKRWAFRSITITKKNGWKTFISLSAWEDMASRLIQIPNGTPVTVDGHLDTSKDKKTNVWVLNVVVDSIEQNGASFEAQSPATEELPATVFDDSDLPF